MEIAEQEQEEEDEDDEEEFEVEEEEEKFCIQNGVALDVDEEGNMVVCDNTKRCLAFFDRTGRFCGRIETQSNPERVAVLPNGDIVATVFGSTVLRQYSTKPFL